jgi:hypothetical protein
MQLVTGHKAGVPMYKWCSCVECLLPFGQSDGTACGKVVKDHFENFYSFGTAFSQNSLILCNLCLTSQSFPYGALKCTRIIVHLAAPLHVQSVMTEFFIPWRLYLHLHLVCEFSGYGWATAVRFSAVARIFVFTIAGSMSSVGVSSLWFNRHREIVLRG